MRSKSVVRVLFASATLLNLGFAGFAWLATHRPRPPHGVRPEKLGLQAEEVRTGGTFSWVVAGSGPDTAFLFHGYGGTASNLLDEARWFHDRGYTTVCSDFPAAGESTGTATTIGWIEADVVRDVVTSLRHGRTLLFGQSMGSAAILRATGELGLAADALILENPYDNLVTTVANRFTKFHLPRFPGAQLLVFYGGHELGFDGFALNPVEYAAKVSIPTLLMAGANDERVRPAETRAIGEALVGPHTVVLFPGAGHQPMRSANAKKWGEVVGAFLDGG